MIDKEKIEWLKGYLGEQIISIIKYKNNEIVEKSDNPFSKTDKIFNGEKSEIKTQALYEYKGNAWTFSEWQKEKCVDSNINEATYIIPIFHGEEINLHDKYFGKVLKLSGTGRNIINEKINNGEIEKYQTRSSKGWFYAVAMEDYKSKTNGKDYKGNKQYFEIIYDFLDKNNLDIIKNLTEEEFERFFSKLNNDERRDIKNKTNEDFIKFLTILHFQSTRYKKKNIPDTFTRE